MTFLGDEYRRRKRRASRRGDLRIEQLETRRMLAAHAMVAAHDLAALFHPPGVQAPPAFLASKAAGTGAHPEFRLFKPAGSATPFNGPSPYGLSPMQIRHAYGLDQVTLPGTATIADGAGETIAVVDAYNSPNIRNDLHAFDVQFGLADPVGDAFKIVSQTGSTTVLPGIDPSGPGSSGSWDLETSLDVEIVHALAPGANILLVEAASNGAGDLQTAINFARQQAGVVAVSISFGYSEGSGQTTTDSTFTTPAGHPGVTFVAATGDSGIPGFYPAFSPNVVSVGGTTLTVDNAANIVSETGWASSGGGVSSVEAQPAYQNGIVSKYSTTNRTAPDVAFDGDPNTGASIYDSYDYGTANPWVKVGGTSLSAPAWAALIAIADQARSSIGLSSLDGATQTLPMLYSFDSSDFNDIITGNNGSPAGPGYDLVTGRGTPKAVQIVNDLVGGFHVAATNPALGSAVAAPPTDFVVTFSSPYANAGIAAADLSVNGTPADSFSLTDSATVTFHFNTSPITNQGLQTISMPAGVMSRLADGAPLASFTGTFRYDVVPIAIDATTPANNAIVPVPLTTISVHFNEAFDPATIGASDLTVSQGSVSGFSIVDSQTVQYTLTGVNTPSTFSFGLAAGAVTDVYSNTGPAYRGTIFLNGLATPFPTPLTQLKPAGSLIYQGSANSSVLFAGNTVSYALALAAGETLSVSAVASATLQSQLSVVGPATNASATAPAPGATAVIQAVPINLAGTYTITVTGANSSIGSFTLTADLDAAIAANFSGGPNHTLASAQSLNDAFISLGSGADRAAAVSPSSALAGPNAFGYAAAPVAPQFDDIANSGGTKITFFSPSTNLSTQVGPTSPLAISFPFYGTTFNTVFVNPHGLISLARTSVSGSNTDLSSSPTSAMIAPLWDNISVVGSPLSAAYYKVEPTSAGNRLVVEWYHVSFVGGPQTGQATFEAILNPDGSILFNYQSLDGSMYRSGDPGPTVGIKNANASGTDPLVIAAPGAVNSLVAGGNSLLISRSALPAVTDYYSFSLGAGQTTTLAVAGQNSLPVHVALLDDNGNQVAAGASPGAGSAIAEAVNNFAGPAGIYYALVTGAPGAAYSLTVNRNAALSAGNNVSFSTAQDITAAKGVGGAITAAAPENWFSISLPAGAGLTLQTDTPGDPSSQFLNNLNPAIELYNSSDVLVASGQGSRNQTLMQAIATAGVYRIRVRAADTTTGEYFLSVSVASNPPEVTGVYASAGPAWSDSFYAYLSAHGLGDAQLGYRLSGGAGQLLALPWKNLATISVVFSQNVSINTAAQGLALVGSPDVPAPAPLSGATFSYDASSHTARWTFATPLPDDKYLLNIPAAAVANVFGVPLDGEWTTGASNFPSGDGFAGGDFGFRFNMLAGDVDQNGMVTGVDGNSVRMTMLETTATASYSPLADINGDGAITGQDGAAVRMQLLHALPATDPSPPPSGFARAAATTASQPAFPATTPVATSSMTATVPLSSPLNGSDSPASKPLASLLEMPPGKPPGLSTSLPHRMLRAGELLAVRDLLFAQLGKDGI